MKIEGIHGGITVGDKHPPLVCGVLNLSPESFFPGSVGTEIDQINAKIREMATWGARIIDIGAISTRPISIYGGDVLTTDDELARINQHLPAIIKITDALNVAVAIDTQTASVAEFAINMGCNIINDISGLKHDPQMADLVARTDVDLVIMATNKLPGDPCGIRDTVKALKSSLHLAQMAEIGKDKIVIDPGFGGWQGRDPKCDIDLLTNFKKLRQFQLPVYVGVSRKSTIKTLDGGKDPEDRLVGSVILSNYLVTKGAHIIRTHDVKETMLGIKVYKNLQDL